MYIELYLARYNTYIYLCFRILEYLRWLLIIKLNLQKALHYVSIFREDMIVGAHSTTSQYMIVLTILLLRNSYLEVLLNPSFFSSSTKDIQTSPVSYRAKTLSQVSKCYYELTKSAFNRNNCGAK